MNGYEEIMTGASAAAPADMYDPYAETATSASQRHAGYDSCATQPEEHSGFFSLAGYDDPPLSEAAVRRGAGGRGRGGDRGRRGGGGFRDGGRGGGGPMRRDRGGGGGGGRGGGGGGGRRPEKPAVSTKLYVTNLPDTVRRSDLVKLFEQYGKVTECDIVKHYAFIHYGDPDEAKSAVDGLNQTDFQGSELKVELSISRVRQKPGMGGPNECYKCGKGGHWSKDCPTDQQERDHKNQGRGDRDRSRERDRDRDRDRDRERRRPAPAYADDYYRPLPPDPYYRDPYYRDRYPPPPPYDRYRAYDPYERRRAPPPYYDDPYYRDPYARPPPEVYSRAPLPRDPYYPDPYKTSYQPVGEETAHAARAEPQV